MDFLSLISPAHAQETATATQVAGAPGQPATATDSLMNFLPLFLILIVMYLFLIRPQQQKFHQHQEMLKGLRRGDKVVTGGGIIGKIVKLDESDVVAVEIAESVRVNVQRGTITAVIERTEPVANSNKSDAA